MREIRIEVNLDIVKADIDPEMVRKVVEATLREKFDRPYIQVQAIKIVR